jgi:hypothetical protein
MQNWLDAPNLTALSTIGRVSAHCAVTRLTLPTEAKLFSPHQAQLNHIITRRATRSELPPATKRSQSHPQYCKGKDDKAHDEEFDRNSSFLMS